MVRHLRFNGWQVNVAATPAAERWVADDQDLGDLVKTYFRAPEEPKSRERADVVLAAPMTFNSINKVACGIADSLAHSVMNEALGRGIPFLGVPMVNEYLGSHPAWNQNVQRLSDAGVSWISPHDGAIGEIQLIESGSGRFIAERFDMQWISPQLPKI